MTSKQLVASAAVIGAVLCAVRAHAQDRDPAAAQALFDQARSLMNAQRYPEACLKFAESLRLDPGIGTQFHLAVCQEHEGKLASAWAAFLEVASVATATGQSARAQAASRRAALLEPRLPRLRIAVPAQVRAPGLEITRDGIAVGQAQWDLALPVDPGTHEVEVTAPGRRAFAGAVSVAEGAAASFEVPVLEPAAVSSSKLAPFAPVPSTAAQQKPAPVPAARLTHATAPAQEPRASSSGPGALVIGLGALGVVGLGAGAVLGLMASSKYDESKDNCEPGDENRCNPDGVAQRDDALTMSDLSTVGFVVGGAALAGAGILWLLSGDSESAEGSASVAQRAGPSGARVTVLGEF